MLRATHLLVTAAVLVAPATSFAQTRPDTLTMSCRQAAGVVQQAGAIVLRTGPNLWDRFVSSKAYCQRDEQTEPRWLKTGDTAQCFVGYTCERRYGDPQSR
jgi:hypothetical protein